MIRHTLKILQDSESVSDHFGSLCIKRLKYIWTIVDDSLWILAANSGNKKKLGTLEMVWRSS